MEAWGTPPFGELVEVLAAVVQVLISQIEPASALRLAPLWLLMEALLVAEQLLLLSGVAAAGYVGGR
eukprot:9444745-Ditylum_brightwellii.AAC.1